jgi:hypothetical protein
VARRDWWADIWSGGEGTDKNEGKRRKRGWGEEGRVGMRRGEEGRIRGEGGRRGSGKKKKDKVGREEVITAIRTVALQFVNIYKWQSHTALSYCSCSCSYRLS